MLAVESNQTFLLVNGAPEETDWSVKQGYTSLMFLPGTPTWWSSRDNDYVSSCEGLCEAIITRFVAFDYLAEKCSADARLPIGGS